MKAIHVCYSLELGGITALVRSLVGLNGTTPGVHDLVVIGGLGDQHDFERYCRVHNIELRRQGTIAALAHAYRIVRGYEAIFLHSLHPVVVLVLPFTAAKAFVFQHGMTASQGPLVKRSLKKAWFSVVPILLRAPVIFSTNFAVDELRKKGVFVPQSRACVIPFGIDLPARPKPVPERAHNASFKVGMAGRLVAQKRFARVIESFATYNGRTRFVLRIAGTGPLESVLKECAGSLDTERISVEFLGRVDDMASFYQALDFFVLPSVEESFGLVVLEALAQGVPVAVFADVGGAIELIDHGANGFILDDKAALVPLWEQLDHDPGILERMRARIREKELDDYSVQAMRRRLDGLAADNI